MCLDTITKRYKRPSKKEVFAYKVFNIDEMTGNYRFEFYGHDGKRDLGSRWFVPTRVWLKANEETIGYEKTPYTSGFHGIRNIENALGWADGNQVVVRVRMRYVHTEGLGMGGANIVAREMYVPKPRKQK